MQKHLFQRAARMILAGLMAVLLTTGFPAGALFTYADDQSSTDTEATAEMPLAEKAMKMTADGMAANQAAEAEAAKEAVKNPLTGLGGYNQAAIGKRPLAVVVENDPKARPQWGIDDPEKSPDIILEGEMEGGETRTLWIYADMTALPSQVGPVRSARPPYIRFSELFDAIFIHCGMSSSSGNYTGADSVFQSDGVDHIDMLKYGEGSLFGRDYSRTSMLEHTAFLRGEQVASAIAGTGFRTDVNESRYTTFAFQDPNAKKDEKEDAPAAGSLAATLRAQSALTAFPPAPEEPVGTPCNKLDLSFSSATAAKHWEYSEADGMYHTQDYYTDVSRKSILLLFDSTQYITKYTSSGEEADTYTNYLFAGGSGKLACDGRIQDITWSVEDGRIALKDSNGDQLLMTSGKIWIGWCSDTYGGYATPSE